MCASSPAVKNKNNITTTSLSKNPSLKPKANDSGKGGGKPKAEQELPPQQTHEFFVRLNF
jgi:hypothetical protein